MPQRQIRGFVTAVVLALAMTHAALAEATMRRLIDAPEASRWRAVGSLRVLGKPYCTAVLISQTEAITAAHCVVNRTSGQRTPVASYVIVLGQRDGGFAAVRRVTRTAFPPAFLRRDAAGIFESIANDTALLELDRPVSADEAMPIEVATWASPVGDVVDIVGYERDGPKSATIREGCKAIASQQGVTKVTCDVIVGLSGSPVLLSQNPDDPPRLVANLSARDGGAAFVVAVAAQLAALRAQLRK